MRELSRRWAWNGVLIVGMALILELRRYRAFGEHPVGAPEPV